MLCNAQSSMEKTTVAFTFDLWTCRKEYQQKYCTPVQPQKAGDSRDDHLVSAAATAVKQLLSL